MTMNNAMTLPNVRAPETTTPVSEYKVTSAISNLIWELALKNPLWVFKTESFQWGNEHSNGHTLIATAFSVYYNSEKLGSIGREYLGGNKGHGIKVANERIANGMKRGGAYKTEDEAKALAKVKKMFKPSSMDELLVKAEGAAATVMSQERIAKDRLVRQHRHNFQEKAVDFCVKGPGLEIFLAHAKKHGDTTVDKTLDMIAVSEAELSTIEGIKSAIGTAQAALVVVDEGKYLVKILDNVQLYDDTTFPAEFRGKLGMLKLVNERQFITDVGCKVSNEVFVIKRDEQTEEPK